MTQSLNVTPDEFPREFIRGQSLWFKMKLPPKIQAAALFPYNLSCTLRRYKNPGENGFIANLSVGWTDSSATEIEFSYPGETGEWPLGLAEFDVLFTHPTTGRKIRTRPTQIMINDGVAS